MSKGMYRYWGKAKKTIEVEYCLSRGSDAEIAARHNISLPELKKRAIRHGWEKVEKGKIYSEYHLLPYHSLDVAAVGQVMLEQHPFLLKRLAEIMSLPKTEAKKWCVFLLGIHDLGKFAESFQQLRTDLRSELWPGE